MTGSASTTLRVRFRRYWQKHRTLFWTLHSVWALATGVVVIWLARERYGFVPWVLLFLGLTWLSTLYFGRSVIASTEPGGDENVPGAAEEATSYLTRTMYQESLFFLLPFYAYSTVVSAPNVVFIILLGGLAVVSCLDLVFDRWLRESRVGSLLFFALVAFAGMNLLIPILVSIDPTTATRIAAGLAVASAVPLALNGERPSRKGTLALALTAVVFLVLTIGLPRLVPPVPLRLQDAAFSSGIDRETLVLADTVPDGVAASRLGDGLYVRMEIFAPAIMPTEVNLRWERDGTLLRASRTIEITAHELGFRIWDAWRPESGVIEPGRYRVTLETRLRRVFGRTGITVAP
ncbi:MAG: DUF5924 family protein [Gemmatimonadota bacterium]